MFPIGIVEIELTTPLHRLETSFIALQPRSLAILPYTSLNRALLYKIRPDFSLRALSSKEVPTHPKTRHQSPCSRAELPWSPARSWRPLQQRSYSAVLCSGTEPRKGIPNVLCITLIFWEAKLRISILQNNSVDTHTHHIRAVGTVQCFLGDPEVCHQFPTSFRFGLWFIAYS